jgi:hypothetical protein
MADNFQLFRLSLLTRADRDLFRDGPEPTRAEHLAQAFAREWTFEHYGSDFYFKPDPERSVPDGLLGRLGRAVTIEENLPPDEGLVEASHDGWKACVIVVDPGDHEDGQKASVQVDVKVGKPVSIFTALIKAINEGDPSAPYTIEAEPIFDADTFWEFAAENDGEITSLTFEFVAPNGLWNASSSLKDELRVARETIGAQKVINTFKSDDGLETNNEQIKEAVNYIGNGSGEIKARARGNKKFSSTDKPKTVSLEKDTKDSEPLIVKVAKHIGKVLGRE